MKKRLYVAIFGVLVAGTILVILLISTGETPPSTQREMRNYDNPYIGSMHPHVMNEGPGECSECGMNLSRLEGHKPGTVIPPLSNIYTSPDNPMYVHEGPDVDPRTGTELIPITESPIFEAPSPSTPSGGRLDPGKLFTCGMHPDVIQEGPGTCPICGMELTLVRGSGKIVGGERKIAYWVAPMDPNYISDKPGKSPMGMDLAPVYEDDPNEGMVSIDPVTMQNIGVTTTIAEIRDLTIELRTNGTVTIAEDAEYRVNPKISGWIENLYVSRTGDFVEAGDPLLDLYSPELVSAQEEYLLTLKSAKLIGESDIDRARISSGDLLTAARTRLELWDITSDQIDELERTGKIRRTLTLYSPTRGVVLHKNAVRGAAVKAGTDLFRIADLSTVWIDAQVFEYELPWVRKGQPVEVYSPYDPTLKLKGRVDYVYPYLDAKTRTARIRIVVPNPRLDLKPDMYVDVRIDAQSKKDAIVVPKSAVLRSGKRDIVFIALGEGRFMPREIKLGLESGEYYEIADGLASGTPVVTSAQFLLDSEAKLQEAIQRRLNQRMQTKK